MVVEYDCTEYGTLHLIIFHHLCENVAIYYSAGLL